MQRLVGPAGLLVILAGGGFQTIFFVSGLLVVHFYCSLRKRHLFSQAIFIAIMLDRV